MAKGIGSNKPTVWFKTVETGVNWNLADFDLDAGSTTSPLFATPPFVWAPKHDCPYCACKVEGGASSQT